MSFLSLERNAPCICGSGKKYKKCCLFTIEKLGRHWNSNRWEWMNPDLAVALALACGLPQGEGECVPSLAEIEKALDYISQKIENHIGMEELSDAFTDLLNKEESFSFLYFSDHVVEDFLDNVEDGLGDFEEEPEQEEIEEVFGDELEDYLPEIVAPGMSEELVSHLIKILRMQKYTREELAALIFAMLVCLIDPGPNQVWDTIFRTSVAAYLSEQTDEEEEYEEDGEAIIPDASWPITRAFIPDQECWNISGFGSAGIVQRQPDGLYTFVVFYLNLFYGIESVLSKGDLSEKELDRSLGGLREIALPWQEGPLELTARYIWGAYAWSKRDEDAGLEEIEPYLAIVPQPEGEEEQWLEDFSRNGSLTPSELVRVVEECGSPDEMPEDKEYVIFTTIKYLAHKPEEIAKKLDKLRPEFDVAKDKKEKGWRISWREYSRVEESPPKGSKGAGRVLGGIRLNSEGMVVETRTLSLACRIAFLLKEIVGDYISLESVSWKSYVEMLNEIQREREGSSARK